MEGKEAGGTFQLDFKGNPALTPYPSAEVATEDLQQLRTIHASFTQKIRQYLNSPSKSRYWNVFPDAALGFNYKETELPADFPVTPEGLRREESRMMSAAYKGFMTQSRSVAYYRYRCIDGSSDRYGHLTDYMGAFELSFLENLQISALLYGPMRTSSGCNSISTPAP